MTTKPSRGRRKATTEVGRSILQKERQRLAKEQADFAEAMVREAKARARAAERTTERAEDIGEQQAIARSVVRNVAGVLAVEDVMVPIKCIPTSSASAWTDFDQIHVGYQTHDDIRLTLAAIRGMLYHEGGHVRWTVPFQILRTLANNPEVPSGLTLGHLQAAWNGLEDQRMETAVVSDSPAKAAYFTPMIMTIHTPDPDHATANYPLLVWRRYLPQAIRRGARAGFVGLYGEEATRKIEQAVTHYIRATTATAMWSAVVEYAFLMQAISLTPRATDDHSKHSTYGGKDDGEQMEEAADKMQIPVSPEWGDDEQDAMPIPVVDDDDDESDEDEDEDEDDEEYEDDEDEADTDQDVRWSEDDEDEDEDEDDDEPSNAGSDDTPNEGMDEDEDEGTDPDSGDHHEQDDTLTQDDLDEALKDAEAERDADQSLNRDVEEYENLRSGHGDFASSLLPYITGTSTDAAVIGEAEVLAVQVEEAFKAATADRAPAWQEGQRRGVLNPLRYRTRQPGQVDFFKAWNDSDLPGYNLAVSVLLDYSLSMKSSTTALAQAGYATKRACDLLGIPCTVLLWDSQATVLWDAAEEADGVPTIKAKGGTDPLMALNDLDHHRYERETHIVLMMTDGEWGGDWTATTKRGGSTAPKHSLASYKDPGRRLVGFGYGGEHLATTMFKYGCDEAFGIRDLMDIPRHLEQILIDMA